MDLYLYLLPLPPPPPPPHRHATATTATSTTTTNNNMQILLVRSGLFAIFGPLIYLYFLFPLFLPTLSPPSRSFSSQGPIPYYWGSAPVAAENNLQL